MYWKIKIRNNLQVCPYSFFFNCVKLYNYFWHGYIKRMCMYLVELWFGELYRLMDAINYLGFIPAEQWMKIWPGGVVGGPPLRVRTKQKLAMTRLWAKPHLIFFHTIFPGLYKVGGRRWKERGGWGKSMLNSPTVQWITSLFLLDRII